ncbi:MAG: PVC-type heme-binding CxxCH protein [Planctomycetaceae bacterium]
MNHALVSLRVWIGARFLTGTLVLIGSGPAQAANVESPQVLDPALTIELVAAEPEIVTPVSCRFDSRGRLFVVESHTHFPPADYDGPQTDRIKIFDDPDGDGKLDRVRIFHEGTVKTMGLVIGQDDTVYLATRAAILRLRDTDGDDKADVTESLIKLDTAADYPHNGLSGLLLEEPAGQAAKLTFGMGENFGEKYVLSGTDGSRQEGGGEGGNIFQCSPDGTNLERVATGFWNPFGLCRDEAGRLLMVDNDADAMPPCRIVHVQPHGDYGFQFRFGRAGTHPLQAWNGEFPGTLPMVAGTGEAPCAIAAFRGQYWVTSWGDNRIERYTPAQQGNSITATREIAIQGGAMFRPVDMVIASDGSMYVTDWVDRSYNVHRKGRIWRVRFSKPAATEELKLVPAKSELTNAEGSPADQALSKLVQQRWATIANPVDDQVAARRRSSILTALRDEDERVRLYAVRWAAETGDSTLLPEVQSQLDRESVSPRMVAAVAAATSYLETGKVEKGGFDALTRQRLVQLVQDPSKPLSTRRTALRLVPPDAPQWNIDDLSGLVREAAPGLQRDAARHLAVAAGRHPQARSAVAALFELNDLEDELRLDLEIGRLPADTQPVQAAGRPENDDLDGWMRLVGEGGDAEKGWRVFFGNRDAKCSSCHAREGRGAGVGPDLTSVAGTLDRRRLLDSMLNPSREIGPMYTTWKVLTTDGRTIAGLKLNGGGVGQSARYLLADATTVDVPMEQIEVQEAAEKSIMPDGLVQQMSIDDLRDLLAYLSQPAESSLAGR